jgi:hypothetical protein
VISLASSAARRASMVRLTVPGFVELFLCCKVVRLCLRQVLAPAALPLPRCRADVSAVLSPTCRARPSRTSVLACWR